MRFYTTQHRFYCGIDLHARTMYVCILNQQGEIVLHRNLKASPDALLKAIAPYRDDLVIAVECMFTWYWLADLCAQAVEPRYVFGAGTHHLYPYKEIKTGHETACRRRSHEKSGKSENIRS